VEIAQQGSRVSSAGTQFFFYLGQVCPNESQIQHDLNSLNDGGTAGDGGRRGDSGSILNGET
jgi:hypothetical protein